MQKGKKIEDYEKWERCAKLAIDWNSSKIARNSIFNSDNCLYWRVSHFVIGRFVTKAVTGVLVKRNTSSAKSNIVTRNHHHHLKM